jgi:flagella basal body P-ring formation protein FlgA
MMIRSTLIGLAAGALALTAFAAFAGDKVTLRDTLSSQGSLVTFGDLFENAGAAREVTVAKRNQPSATLFLDANAVQRLAAQYGLDWDNAGGLRRLIVRPQALLEQPPPRPDARLATQPKRGSQSPQRRDLAAPTFIIQKADLVQVTYRDQGLMVSIQGRAMSAAALGQTFSVINPASKRTIDAVATGPGQAMTGPGMQALASDPYAPRQLAILP